MSFPRRRESKLNILFNVINSLDPRLHGDDRTTRMKKILIIFTGLLLAFVTFYFFKISQLDNKLNPPSVIIQEKTTYNFLLLGYGGGVHEGTYLTDTVIIAHIDTKTNQVTLFSIPRDLWVKLPTKSGSDFHTKINSVYQAELFPKDYPDLKKVSTKMIISQITGLPIDGYISLNFKGFTEAIDILGGVDINIEKAFIDSQYPIDGKEKDLCDQEELFKKAEPYITPPFDETERLNKFKEDPKIEEFVKNATDSPELAFPCRYEKLEFKTGLTHMNGETALKYVRSRHSETDGGDFARARRQQKLIEVVKNKVLSISFLSKIIPLMDEFKKDVKTDINLDTIKKFISQSDKINKFTISPFILTDQNILENAVSDDRQYILVPNEGIDNWDGLQKLINNTINDITPTSLATSPATLK